MTDITRRQFINLGTASVAAISSGLVADSVSTASERPESASKITKDHAAINLRGYGKVSATFATGRVVFECESVGKADIVLGKLLADLFWDANGEAAVGTLDVAGKRIVIHGWSPYGYLAVARVGSQVIAAGAEDERTLRDLVSQSPEILHSSAVFVPEKPYPRYLDHYDLRAFKAYTAAMSSPRDFGLDSHWRFIDQFGLGGIAFQSLSITNQFPAPSVISFVQSDYEMSLAEHEGGAASIGLGTGGDVPVWVYNSMPDGMMRPSPTTQMGAWNGTGPVGSHYESWWLSAQEKASGSLRFLREAMQRYRDNPAMSAWHLYTGVPGAEFGFHDRAGEYWDYSQTGTKAFRTWLRDVRGYTLKALSERWHANPHYYWTWDQVQIPDANAFFRGEGGLSRRISEGWRWVSARDGVHTPPDKDDKSWIAVDMPPSQQQALLPWGEAFYRVEFDSGDYAGHPQVWLACSVLARSTNPTIVWLNGEQVTETATPDSQPIGVSVGGKLRPGPNELILRVPRQGPETAGADVVREGKVLGPIFLCVEEPKAYPFLGELDNARYVDLRDWQADGVVASHETMLDTALATDPDHPFNLSGSADRASDRMTELAAKYGASCQHTGREAWYHPWWAGIGLLGGFYGTSEESGTASADVMTRELGWMLLDGDSSHNLFQNIEDYQLLEKETGWFTKNRRAIQCFGKYLRATPQIAIFRSGRNILLNIPDPWDWDLGRGALQSCHYDNAYATETELKNGLASACPVLFDSGTQVMDGDVIDALHRYILGGGTFVALHQTGLHSSTSLNAQPLARLSGLTSKPHSSARLNMLGIGDVLSTWAGRAFTGQGVSLIPMAERVAVPGEMTQAIARWDDGDIAIAARRIGKGRIIQLGSTFWRDEILPEFLEQLFTDLGVVRNASAADPAIWARKATSKNGLQDWLLTYNSSDKPRTADVRLAMEFEPAQVWDLLTREPVSTTYSSGFVVIPGVDYKPQSVRLFAVKRGGLVDGLQFWWGEKTRYWKRPPASKSTAVALLTRGAEASNKTSVGDETSIAINRWRFSREAESTSNGGTDWLLSEYDDRMWRPIASGPWNLLEHDLKDWKGTGLYRCAFEVPKQWHGQRVVLNLFDWDRPIVYDHGEFFVNGTSVATYQAHGWSQTYAYDITSLVAAGPNILAVQVQGGQEFSGICGSVWIDLERRFASQIDLAGTWRVIRSDYRTEESTLLPGKPYGRYLARAIQVPDSWAGRTIYLHLETGTQWAGCVVVNGNLISNNSFLHPFSPRLELNLSPCLAAGMNEIELWPYATIPNLWKETVSETEMPILAIRLGVV